MPEASTAAERAQSKRSPGELAAVTDRNHQNGSDVIDDRKRQHEDPQALRDAPPQESQAADDERGVGRHDRAPAVRAFSAQLERQVQGRGHEHPTQRGRDRERGHTRASQLAQDQLALELQRDHEEEERHQTVVDPLSRRSHELERAHPNADGQLPGAQEGVGPGRVGQRQGGDGGQQQHAAAESLDAQEPRERLRQPVHELRGQPIEPRIR
jgi:hypothetical protein